MSPHPTHHWVKTYRPDRRLRMQETWECKHCGVRAAWPAATRPCKVSRTPVKLTFEARLAVEAEAQRALDALVEDCGYRVHSPTAIYGRDGRRRTGI